MRKIPNSEFRNAIKIYTYVMFKKDPKHPLLKYVCNPSSLDVDLRMLPYIKTSLNLKMLSERYEINKKSNLSKILQMYHNELRGALLGPEKLSDSIKTTENIFKLDDFACMGAVPLISVKGPEDLINKLTYELKKSKSIALEKLLDMEYLVHNIHEYYPSIQSKISNMNSVLKENYGIDLRCGLYATLALLKYKIIPKTRSFSEK